MPQKLFNVVFYFIYIKFILNYEHDIKTINLLNTQMLDNTIATQTFFYSTFAASSKIFGYVTI